MRVLRAIEPISYAGVSADSTERTVTEGFLLRNWKTGKLLTINIDGGKLRRGMALLWPNTLYVISFCHRLSPEVCYRQNSTPSN